jgi:hypothetical protein
MWRPWGLREYVGAAVLLVVVEMPWMVLMRDVVDVETRGVMTCDVKIAELAEKSLPQTEVRQ